MKKYNFGMSAVLFGISIWLILTARGYGNAVDGTAMGAGEWPTILAVILMILAVVLFLQTVFEIIREKKKAKGDTSGEKTKVIDFTGKGMIRVYIIVGILAVFYLILHFFGFWIASVLAIPAILFVMGERKWWKILALTAGILIFVFLVFDLALGLTLPVGRIFR